jgi:hypothetical protein
MACSGTGPILSIHGSGVDHPFETIDKMGADGKVQALSKLTS